MRIKTWSSNKMKISVIQLLHSLELSSIDTVFCLVFYVYIRSNIHTAYVLRSQWLSVYISNLHLTATSKNNEKIASNVMAIYVQPKNSL